MTRVTKSDKAVHCPHSIALYHVVAVLFHITLSTFVELFLGPFTPPWSVVAMEIKFLACGHSKSINLVEFLK